MEKYDHTKIERRWQDNWAGKSLNQAMDIESDKNRFVLDMFPYPSGTGLHVGHVESYTATDIYSRYLRMRGYNVLHPQGWDAFGLPAENFAVRSGVHPSLTTRKAIQTFKRQINSLGFSYDWSREINSSHKDYYKWTQWLFLLLYKHGLAYRKEASVNWCEQCQTVLANEQAENGRCERCDSLVSQKSLKQWFFKITDFIEDQENEGRIFKGLLSGLDGLDWPESTKTAQRNWINKSIGAKVKFIVSPINDKEQKAEIEVFTTRPDTLFGATYLVVNPEHEIISEFSEYIINHSQVLHYANEARQKTELQRTDLNKDKTGVEIAGISALNPANNQEIPIFAADYVLAGYGTGAIMAVPAHDERDWEFAHHHGINTVQVVKPKHRGTAIIIHGFEGGKNNHWYNWAKEQLEFFGYDVVLPDMPSPASPKLEEWQNILNGYKGKLDKQSIVIGHSLGAYVAAYFVSQLGFKINSLYMVAPATNQLDFRVLSRRHPERDFGSVEAICRQKIEWDDVRQNTHYAMAFLSDNDEYIPFEATKEYFKAREIPYKNLSGQGHFQGRTFERLFDYIKKFLPCYAGEGENFNSGWLDGLETKESKKKMAAWLEENKLGKSAVTYKLRDWLVSRQRYWGAPIPIIHCLNCGEVPVREEDLPVELPDDVDFKPTGESPLKYSKKFINVKCPKCGQMAKREADTMDTFVCSSWYYLRYADPANKEKFADKDKLKKWLPVDVYVGGAEHSVLHLLYSRFFTKFLQKYGYLDFNEPFKKLRHQGIILAENGAKMSKSKGNVVNPDDVVNEFGADSLRMYEMFMGPLEDMKPWNIKGIAGVRRFIERTWNLQLRIKNEELRIKNLDKLLHKTIRKVGEDIELFKFNTAIAAMMIFLKEAEKAKNIPKDVYEKLILILSPFAPHLCEEIWRRLGHQGSIFRQAWPEYDQALARDEKKEIAVQINGKIRDKLMLDPGIGEEAAITAAKESGKVKRWIEGKEIKKEIYVKGRLVSFVVKDS